MQRSSSVPSVFPRLQQDRRFADVDWDSHPLGPVDQWSAALRVCVHQVLASSESMYLVWGTEGFFFFNRPYEPILGPRAAYAMGARFEVLWADAWPSVRETFELARAGTSTRHVDMQVPMSRYGVPEQTWWTFSFSPVFDETGEIAGVLCITNEVTDHVLRKISLRESEERSRQILDSATDYAVIATDIEGRVQRWNTGAQHLLGWSEPDMLGQTMERFFTPEDRRDHRMDIEMRAAREEGRGNDERWHLRKDGERFWGSGAMMPLRNDAGAVCGYVKVLRNRTHERRQEQRLGLLAQIAAGLLAAQDPDAVLAPVLENSSELLGFDESYSYVLTPDCEHLRMTHSVGASESTRNAFARVRLDVPICGIVAQTRTPLIIKNLQQTTEPRYEVGRAGGYKAFAAFPVLANDKLHGVMSFAARSRVEFDEDALSFFATLARYSAIVRSRLDTEAELREWARTLEQRVDERTRERDLTWRVSRDLFVTLDDAGRLDSVNPAWTDVLGWQEVRVVGCDFLGYVQPEDVDAARALLERLLRPIDAVEAAEIDVRMTTDQGQGRWISWSFVRHRDVVYGAGRDISERKLLEEQLRQSQKMEAVGQLTGGLAHDFNNLLAGISGALELSKLRIARGQADQIGRYIDAGQDAVKRAAALTHRLLAFSRRQTLAPKTTHVGQLIAGMQDLIARTVGPAIRLAIENDRDLWLSLIDASQFENAILNLCINARDAMPHGGQITIRNTNEVFHLQRAVKLGLAPGAYVTVCVTDTGVGMSADVLTKAFEPFFTTKPIGMGTGLGLSMIYGFAKQSGGTVELRSEPGKGTVVCIHLPRHEAQTEPPEELDAQAGMIQGDGQTVMVVDDEPTVRLLVTEVLKDLGYRSIEAEDGVTALKLLNSSVQVDLLITDVGLPNGINGRQVADAARVQRPRLKVLFITGYAENAVLNHGHLGSDMHVMTKPFAIDALALRVQEILE